VEFKGDQHPVREEANGRTFQRGLPVVDDLRTLTELDPETLEVLSL
jgi:hypothetical protein